MDYNGMMQRVAMLGGVGNGWMGQGPAQGASVPGEGNHFGWMKKQPRLQAMAAQAPQQVPGGLPAQAAPYVFNPFAAQKQAQINSLNTGTYNPVFGMKR